jgi:hypothetical protein
VVQKRTLTKTYDVREAEPFATPEDAWIWYFHCQQARDEGARFQAGLGDIARPCAPDDIAREVRRLYRRRLLSGGHLRILARFGAECGVAQGAGPEAERLWREALDRLSSPLRAKGIVA